MLAARRGEALAPLGLHKKALCKLRRTLALDVRNDWAWRRLVETLIGLRRLRPRPQFRPDDAALLIKLAEELQKAGRHAEAIAHLEHALQLDPTNARTTRLLAEWRTA